MKNKKIQDCKMKSICFLSKNTRIALYLLFSFYSCIFFNIHAQTTITTCKGNSIDLVPPTTAGTIVEWKDQAGNDRYTTEIVIKEMEMLGGGQQDAPSVPQGEEPPLPSSEDVPF